MNAFRLLSLLGVAALLLVGCGGSGADTTERQYWSFESPWFGLDGEPGPENAGPQVAEKLGYFRDLGLQPKINPPLEPVRAAIYVGQGVSDVGITQEPQAVLAQEEGIPLVIFGSLVSEPTMAMIWLPKSGIEEVADLKGKTIAYPGVPFQKDFLEYVLEGAGLRISDVKLESVGYELTDALASGRADAIFGGSGNEEGAQLETRGFDPVVTELTDLGVPAYDELVLIARRDRHAKDPELFQRIRDAAIKGNQAAASDPKGATEAVVDVSLGSADPKPTRAGLKATAPLLSQTGDVDEEQLEELIDWMHEQGMIRRKIPASSLLADS